MSPENEEKLSPVPEPLLQFKFPENEEEEIFLIELEDGRRVARTKRELEEGKKEGKK